jgi:hypothetical protein
MLAAMILLPAGIAATDASFLLNPYVLGVVIMGMLIFGAFAHFLFIRPALVYRKSPEVLAETDGEYLYVYGKKQAKIPLSDLEGAMVTYHLPFIYSSEFIDSSKVVVDSKYVDDSAYIYNSDFVSNSNKILDARNVTNSSEVVSADYVMDSYGVFDSKNIVNCHAIWKGENQTDCAFCFGCQNLTNSLFCIQITDGDYYLFNKKIDKNRYEMIHKQYHKYIKAELHFTNGWPEGNNLPIKSYDYRKHLADIPDSFWAWVRTLPGYSPDIMYSLTFNPQFLN